VRPKKKDDTDLDIGGSVYCELPCVVSYRPEHTDTEMVREIG